MAYEHIDVSELKSSLRKLDNINNNKLKNLASSINAGDWSGNSRVRIVEALKTVSSYYDNIRNYLEKCKTAADYIDEYKRIVKKNNSLNANIESIKNNYYNYISYDKYGGSRKNDKLNPEMATMVDNYNKSINSNNEKLKQIEAKVNNLVSS